MKSKIMSNIIYYLSIFAIAISLISCQSEQDRLHRKLSKDDTKIEVYPGHYKVVKSASVQKSSKKPENKAEIGMASWYGIKKAKKYTKGPAKNSFHGQKTANGDMFNTDALTAAHKTLPIPSIARVTNLSNGKSVLVMINDRGPYAKGRIIDVSSKVATALNFKHKGVTQVKVEPMHKETEDLLKKISLKSEHGSKPHGKIKNPNCTVNCFVKLMNIKEGVKID